MAFYIKDVGDIGPKVSFYQNKLDLGWDIKMEPSLSDGYCPKAHQACLISDSFLRPKMMY